MSCPPQNLLCSNAAAAATVVYLGLADLRSDAGLAGDLSRQVRNIQRAVLAANWLT
jgi:hypothetical protein